jgi:hypothetical protein
LHASADVIGHLPSRISRPSEPPTTIHSWQLDRQKYRVSPLMSNGQVSGVLELSGLFEQYREETSEE